MGRINFDFTEDKFPISAGISGERTKELQVHINTQVNKIMKPDIERTVRAPSGKIALELDVRNLINDITSIAQNQIEYSFLIFHAGVVSSEIKHKYSNESGSMKQQKLSAADFMLEILKEAIKENDNGKKDETTVKF